MGSRAVVIAVEKNRATVLLAGGQFKRIKVIREQLVIGQELNMPLPAPWHAMKRAVGAAAILAAMMMGANSYLSYPVHASAVVSVDIKSSIDMVVGGSTPVVLQVAGLGHAGRKLLGQTSLEGLPVKTALHTVTQWANKDGYLSSGQSYVVLGAISRRPSLAWFGKLCHEEKTFLTDNTSWHGKLVTVSMVTHHALGSYARYGISIGRYLLWKENHRSPTLLKIKSKQLQGSPLRMLVHPAVRAPVSTETLKTSRRGLHSDGSGSLPLVSAHPVTSPLPRTHQISPMKQGILPQESRQDKPSLTLRPPTLAKGDRPHVIETTRSVVPLVPTEDHPNTLRPVHKSLEFLAGSGGSRKAVPRG